MLKIKVELESETVQSGFEKAVELATQINCIVEFPYQGVRCISYPNTDFKEGIRQYEEVKDIYGDSKMASTKKWPV